MSPINKKLTRARLNKLTWVAGVLLCLGWLALSAFTPPKAARGPDVGSEHDYGSVGSKAYEFELKDQYDKIYQYRFPKSRVTVLTFGDRKGSEQIEGWVRPLYARYQERVEQYGVAVLNTVPALMRGVVRGIFKNKVKYSVLLDWQGDVARSFSYAGKQANVIVVDRNGRIVYRAQGAATPAELNRVYQQLDKLLASGQ